MQPDRVQLFYAMRSWLLLVKTPDHMLAPSLHKDKEALGLNPQVKGCDLKAAR